MPHHDIGHVPLAAPPGRLAAAGGDQPANRTGLPDGLRAGLEQMSGMAMDAVRVHYRSPEPARIGAHAFARGTDIHLGPGQERHLPHEAWHVVQQAEGRVSPTTEVGGTAVNDDAGLEREADRMGARARAASSPASGLATGGTIACGPSMRPASASPAESRNAPVQGIFRLGGNWFNYDEADLGEKLDAQTGGVRAFAQAGGNRALILAKIKEWDDTDDTLPRVKSYDALFQKAVREVIADRIAAQGPPVAPVPQEGVEPVNPAVALAQQPAVKIARLGRLRRTASDASLGVTGGLRERDDIRELNHRDGQRYTIAGNGDFLLGGPAVHNYQQMIAEMKLGAGTDDRGLATILLHAIRNEPYQAGGAAAQVNKFVALIHGPEVARAAINPIAAAAVLEDVAANGGDLFNAMLRGALFVETDGGAARSQYHRNAEIDQTNADFIQTAANEYDAIARSAARLGYDPEDQDRMDAFMTARAQAHVQAHQEIFHGAAPLVAPQEAVVVAAGNDGAPGLQPDQQNEQADVVPQVAPGLELEQPDGQAVLAQQGMNEHAPVNEGIIDQHAEDDGGILPMAFGADHAEAPLLLPPLPIEDDEEQDLDDDADLQALLAHEWPGGEPDRKKAKFDE